MSVNENIPENPASEYALTFVVPEVELVTDKRKSATCGPIGDPGTPENVKSTVPDAETVVVPGGSEIVHCWTAPSTWVYCPKVTPAAEAVPAVSITTANSAAPTPNLSKDAEIIFLLLLFVLISI